MWALVKISKMTASQWRKMKTDGGMQWLWVEYDDQGHVVTHVKLSLMRNPLPHIRALFRRNQCLEEPQVRKYPGCF